MIRITIEIDGMEVSSTTVQPMVQPTAGFPAPSPELQARAAALGALDAGSAPGGLMSVAPAVTGHAIDAGASREHAASSERVEDPGSKAKTKKK